MSFDKVLIFDISGEYGHFRKFNTTTSPLTYNIPTRSALSGLIGAILGIEREISPNEFRAGVIPVNELFSPERASIAIQLLKPVKKVQIGFNLLDTGKSGASFFNIKNRTQVEFEFLKDPKFRIFFHHEDATLLKALERRLLLRNHHFTPYLGLAQLTAIIDAFGFSSCEKIKTTEDYVRINSVVNLSELTDKEPIEFEKNGSYSVDTMPLRMLRNREVENYAEIIVETGLKKDNFLKVKTPEYYQIGTGANILFL